MLENTKYDFLLQMDWINMDFGAPMTLAATPGVSSVLLPIRYVVMTSLCGSLVGSSPGGGTRVPFYLVGDVVGV